MKLLVNQVDGVKEGEKPQEEKTWHLSVPADFISFLEEKKNK